MPKQTYTAAEAARALGISLDTLRRWDREGRIRTRRDRSNRRLVPASEIDRLRGGPAHRGVPEDRLPASVPVRGLGSARVPDPAGCACGRLRRGEPEVPRAP